MRLSRGVPRQAGRAAHDCSLPLRMCRTDGGQECVCAGGGWGNRGSWRVSARAITTAVAFVFLCSLTLPLCVPWLAAAATRRVHTRKRFSRRHENVPSRHALRCDRQTHRHTQRRQGQRNGRSGVHKSQRETGEKRLAAAEVEGRVCVCVFFFRATSSPALRLHGFRETYRLCHRQLDFEQSHAYACGSRALTAFHKCGRRRSE